MVGWEQVRELALALPEVEEGTSHGAPTFRVAGKAFAGVSRHEGALWARCDRDERPLLVAAKPDVYRLTPHFERSPAFLLVWLEHADEDDVRERLLDAWLIPAPKRLAARFGVG
ncbi:MAG TPA: MmcQ/YjbR family DNA-binding protein [Gaiellaceae bacterium]|nr:MmcQ/YjbR family DNA-binding protein [Gaiellaceae bacterium]